MCSGRDDHDTHAEPHRVTATAPELRLTGPSLTRAICILSYIFSSLLAPQVSTVDKLSTVQSRLFFTQARLSAGLCMACNTILDLYETEHECLGRHVDERDVIFYRAEQRSSLTKNHRNQGNGDVVD
jgi:hypothetical protein